MSVVTRRHVVNMTDVDLVQVNFARFFVWMDDAYDSLLRELGHPLSSVVGSGFATPVVDARCNYLRPVNLDDEFQVRSAVVSTGRSSYTVGHLFEDVSGVFAIGRMTHVWISTDTRQRPVSLPGWIIDAREDAHMPNREERP